MRPALVVNGNNNRIREGLRGFDGVVRVHREMKRTARLRGAREQKDDAGLETACDLGDAVVPDRIARDVYRPRLPIADGQHKPDHVAGQWLNPCRAMPSRSSRNINGSAVRPCQRDGLPWRQPLGMSAKPLGARKRRENTRGPAQEIATGPIEIVGMLVVTEQYGVDRSDVGRRTRRTRCFCQCRVRQAVFAGAIEGRIGQEVKPAEFDECCGTPNQGKTCCAHDRSPFQPRVTR